MNRVGFAAQLMNMGTQVPRGDETYFTPARDRPGPIGNWGRMAGGGGVEAPGSGPPPRGRFSELVEAFRNTGISGGPALAARHLDIATGLNEGAVRMPAINLAADQWQRLEELAPTMYGAPPDRIEPARSGRRMSWSDALRDAGTGGDTEVGHLTPGEIVVPRSEQSPEIMEALREALGDKLGRFTVGGGDDQRNPHTGFAAFYGEPGSDTGAGGGPDSANTGADPAGPAAGDGSQNTGWGDSPASGWGFGSDPFGALAEAPASSGWGQNDAFAPGDNAFATGAPSLAEAAASYPDPIPDQPAPALTSGELDLGAPTPGAPLTSGDLDLGATPVAAMPSSAVAAAALNNPDPFDTNIPSDASFGSAFSPPVGAPALATSATPSARAERDDQAAAAAIGAPAPAAPAAVAAGASPAAVPGTPGRFGAELRPGDYSLPNELSWVGSFVGAIRGAIGLAMPGAGVLNAGISGLSGNTAFNMARDGLINAGVDVSGMSRTGAIASAVTSGLFGESARSQLATAMQANPNLDIAAMLDAWSGYFQGPPGSIAPDGTQNSSFVLGDGNPANGPIGDGSQNPAAGGAVGPGGFAGAFFPGGALPVATTAAPAGGPIVTPPPGTPPPSTNFFGSQIMGPTTAGTGLPAGVSYVSRVRDRNYGTEQFAEIPDFAWLSPDPRSPGGWGNTIVT